MGWKLCNVDQGIRTLLLPGKDADHHLLISLLNISVRQAREAVVLQPALLLQVEGAGFLLMHLSICGLILNSAVCIYEA